MAAQRVIAFAFNSDLSFQQLIALPVPFGPWKWHKPDTSWHYNRASIQEKCPSGKIVLQLVESGLNERAGNYYAGGAWDPRQFAVALSFTPEHEMDSSDEQEWERLRSALVEVLLPSFGATKIRETNWLLQELLAAIEVNVSVAGGGTVGVACSVEPSFRGHWLVMDGDCAEQVRKAAAALRESVPRDRKILKEIARPSSSTKEELVQELLAAIEANKPFATGTGRCPAIPCFDRHDREAESMRPRWEMVEEDRAKRVKKAAAVLTEVLRDGV